MAKMNVLITGAYGLVGNAVYERLSGLAAYQTYGMVRRIQPSARVDTSRFRAIAPARLRVADLEDLAAMRAAVSGMDVVVHMAADSDGRASWESILRSNIIGTRNVFEASRLAGVRRVVFASTNQVIFGYRAVEPYRALLEGRHEDLPADYTPIRHDQPVRPPNEYACSKVFGEALAHVYAHTHGMSCICLRIGWVTTDDRPAHPSLWCSRRDIVQLVERCIQAPESLRFDVFFGQSDNRYNLVDISHPREVLGYAPVDRAEERV
jgi:nucleoside-diphosphate-sugar epimerase